MKRVLFVVRGDATVPSCRFRAYQFSEPLRALGVAAEYFVEGRGESPVDWVRTSFNLMRRLARERYDAVVYQKRLQAERLYLIRAINPNVWYDFDDAVYLGHERRFRKTIRAAGGVIAGNGELASRALQHSSRVEIIPTTVELPGVYSRPDPEGPLRISWVGTAGNLPYLDPVFEALDRVRRGGIEAELHVLTEKPECVPDRDGVVSGRWSTEAEAGAFNRCHLGVMPLLDDAWSRGKCACKALQYLSYARPVVCSPVGVNRPLLEGREFASLAVTTEDWVEAFRWWNASRPDIEKRGLAGREFVKERYDVGVWAESLKATLLGSTQGSGKA